MLGRCRAVACRGLGAAVMDDTPQERKDAYRENLSHTRPQRAAVLAAVVVSILPGRLAFGQATPPSQGMPHNIAVINVGQIMKNRPPQVELDQWKAEFTAEDKRLLDQVHEIQNMQSQLKSLRPDSGEYKQMFETITKKEGDLNVNKSLKQKEFSERRAKLFYTAYCEIQDSVKVLAQRYNLAIVIQYESTPINADNPQEIAQGMSRGVIYVYPPLDITETSADLNRSTVGTAPQGVGVPQQR